MNEAGGYRRSYLTKEQQREAEAAIYGLSPKNMSPQSPQFSHDEIERMRAILAQHDGQSGIGKIKEFDLNNPPKAPYRHQEYPKMVYAEYGRTKIVQGPEEEIAALNEGWQTLPYAAEPVEEVALDPTEQAEVDRLDKIARRKKQARPAAAE